MMKRSDEVVSASEIASWRLSSLGEEPGNRDELRQGKLFHAITAAVEEFSQSVISTGRRRDLRLA
jgi:hypothetical protein